MPADHFARITTPHGSVVELRDLTEPQAAHVAATAASDQPPPPAPAQAATCGNCQGGGGWTEKVKTTTPSGSTVVTDRWVRCKPCKGNGTVPDQPARPAP